MIKAVFFDIDGTLVSFKTHKLPDSTVRAWTCCEKRESRFSSLPAASCNLSITSGRKSSMAMLP